MKTKYTKEELAQEKIVVKCDTQKQADKIIEIFGGKNDYSEFFTYYCAYMDFFISDRNLKSVYSDHKVITASEFFLEDEPESTPEPAPAWTIEENMPTLMIDHRYDDNNCLTEYAVLTNATESAKKQIAEFEQVLAQIKIDAMKLGTRDLARLIKALKAI